MEPVSVRDFVVGNGLGWEVVAEVGQGGEVPGIQGHCAPVTAKKGFSNVSGKSTYFMSGQGLNIFYGQGFIFLVNKGLLLRISSSGVSIPSKLNDINN